MDTIHLEESNKKEKEHALQIIYDRFSWIDYYDTTSVLLAKNFYVKQRKLFQRENISRNNFELCSAYLYRIR